MCTKTPSTLPNQFGHTRTLMICTKYCQTIFPNITSGEPKKTYQFEQLCRKLRAEKRESRTTSKKNEKSHLYPPKNTISLPNKFFLENFLGRAPACVFREPKNLRSVFNLGVVSNLVAPLAPKKLRL